MSYALRALGLRKAFRGRTVVSNVSFCVDPGEIVGLLGPNGAGKTTSFNMVAGLIPMDDGEVTLGERALGNLPLYARARLGIGYLPQEPTIFRGLSVLDNFVAMYEAVGQRRGTKIPTRKSHRESGLSALRRREAACRDGTNTHPQPQSRPPR